MRLSATTAPPLGYDRARVKAGVVHLGLGAFHRAHQAPVFDGALKTGDLRWGIASVAMRSPDVVAALEPQDGLYSLAEQSDAPIAPKVIGSIVETAVAAADPERVIALMASQDAQIVTLTVTEKGYLLPDGDISATPPGLIAAALARRHAAGQGPLSILSCDNRTGNGQVTRAAVLAAGARLALSDAALGWIEREVAFPTTMIDRITPAATEAMIAVSSEALGLEDRAAIWTEPFWQWVIEDQFSGPRPDFAAHGVMMMADVAPWEDTKLRLLNAAHSTLAYRGLLAGHRTVHEAIADPALHALVEQLWDEASATLDGALIDLAAYRAALIERFANPALPHQLIQIAMDGSQKLPPRILGTIAARNPADSPALISGVAAWVDCLASDLPLSDPLLGELRPLAQAGDLAAIFARISADPSLAPRVAQARQAAV